MKNSLKTKLQALSNRFWAAIGSGWFIAALVGGHAIAHTIIWASIKFGVGS